MGGEGAVVVDVVVGGDDGKRLRSCDALKYHKERHDYLNFTGVSYVPVTELFHGRSFAGSRCYPAATTRRSFSAQHETSQ